MMVFVMRKEKTDFDDVRCSVYAIMDCLSKYAGIDPMDITKQEKDDIYRLIEEYKELGDVLKRYFNGICIRGSDTKDDEIYRE